MEFAHPDPDHRTEGEPEKRPAATATASHPLLDEFIAELDAALAAMTARWAPFAAPNAGRNVLRIPRPR